MIFFLNHYESIIFVLDEYGTTTNARIFALKEFINTVAIKARARARSKLTRTIERVLIARLSRNVTMMMIIIIITNVHAMYTSVQSYIAQCISDFPQTEYI